jgi:hypothetical protein
MEVEIRKAALCLIRYQDSFLVAEIRDPKTAVQELGSIDHIWFWNGREIRERAWLYSASSSVDARLRRGETPDLLEANGQRIKTVWRPIRDDAGALPPLCPSSLLELLKPE